MRKVSFIMLLALVLVIFMSGCNKDTRGWNSDHSVYTNSLYVEITQEEYDILVEVYGREDIVDTISQDMVWTGLGKMCIQTLMTYSITGIMDWEDYHKFDGEEFNGETYTCKYVLVDYPEYSVLVESESPDSEIDSVSVVLTEGNGYYCDLSEEEKIQALYNSVYEK